MATYRERAGNHDKDREKDGNLGTPLPRKTVDGTNSSSTVKSRAVQLLENSRHKLTQIHSEIMTNATRELLNEFEAKLT